MGTALSLSTLLKLHQNLLREHGDNQEVVIFGNIGYCQEEKKTDRKKWVGLTGSQRNSHFYKSLDYEQEINHLLSTLVVQTEAEVPDLLVIMPGSTYSPQPANAVCFCF